MNRTEALKIGRVIADRWYKYTKPLIRSRQHIERMKAQKSDSADQSNESQKHEDDLLIYCQEQLGKPVPL